MADESSKTISFTTSRFGDLEVDSSAVIEIGAGLIGFPQGKQFVLLDYNPPFSWLQAVDVPELAFVVVNAVEFGDNYVVPPPLGDPYLDLKKEDEYAIVNLVTVRADAIETTVNLKAPVIVNLRNMRGAQIVLDDQRYSMRFPLWDQENQPGSGENNKP